MNTAAIAAALRILANAFEAPEAPAGTTGQAAAPNLAPTPAEPAKRGRGRPVKGEETTAAAPPAAAQPSEPAATPASSDPFETKAPAAPEATLDEVRLALKTLAAATTQPIALDILKSFGEGASNLTELKPELYGAVVQAATKSLPAVKTEPEPAVADPFEVQTAAAPAAAKPLTLEDVRGVIVETQKRTAQDTVQKVVMKHGGKAPNPATGAEGPSLKALPESAFAAVIAELKALPATK